MRSSACGRASRDESLSLPARLSSRCLPAGSGLGFDNLRARTARAAFPLLSANIRRKADGAVPDFARLYVIKAVNGIKVGLVGLTTRESPVDTRPVHVAGLDFLHFDTALKEVAPRVRQAGADLILNMGHFCTRDMRSLASADQVLVPDDLYAGCQGYPFAQVALSARDMGLGWREPVTAWIKAQKTSWINPLENFLDRP
jgi:hypothetical protein